MSRTYCKVPVFAGKDSESKKDSEIVYYEDIFSRLASDRIIFLSEEIDCDKATEVVALLIWLNKVDPAKEITIYINSIGGSITDGLLTIYDTLQFIKAPVKTICMGEAYSCAAILLAAGTKGLRYAYPSSRIMIHAVQITDVSGTQKQVEDESKRIKSLNKTLMEIISKHTGQSLRKVSRDCQNDKYFSAKEAVKYGLIDQIVSSNKTDILIKKEP